MQQTLQSLPPQLREALLACAVPRWFDIALLGALLDGPTKAEEVLSQLLDHPDAPLTAGDGGRYTLPETVRQELLDILQDEDLSRYQQLQHRAYTHFTARATQAEGETRLALEDEQMYHLEKLFFLLLRAQQFEDLFHLLEGAERSHPQRVTHQHLLAYYQGVCVGEMHRYDQAEQIFGQLLAHSDLADALRARTLNSQGIFYDHQGQFDKAIAHYQQGQALFAQMGDRWGEGKALLNEGIAYLELAEPERAIPCLEQSYQTFLELSEPYYEALALNELGIAHKDLGRWQEAIRYYQESFEIFRRIRDQDGIGATYVNRGEVYHYLGQEDRAEAMYRQALDILLDPQSGNKITGTDALINLGFVYHTQGRFELAHEHYRRALSLAQEIDSQQYISLAHYRSGDLWQRQGHHDKAHDAYRRAIEAIESLRSRVSQDEVKISLLGTRQQVFEAMVLLCLQREQLDQAFHYVERARSRAFLDLLHTRAPQVYETLDEPVVSLEEVQANLPADAALIEYFVTGLVDRGDNIITNLPSENRQLLDYLVLPARIFIFGVTNDQILVREAGLPPAAFRPSSPDDAGGHHFLKPPILQKLHQALIEPVEDLLDGKQTLYLAPHGPLHYVPFQALRSAEGQYLLRNDGPQIVHVPSATVLFRYCQPTPTVARTPEPAPQPCLAAGYNDAGAWRLRYAEDEAQSVADITGGQALVGKMPKKGRIYKEAANYRMLHFSCHGAFNPRNALASCLHLAEDEYLSAEDILKHLHLRADLVTLSACRSGVSKIQRGDELVGLIRAFIYAGTPSLICTLWSVDEVSTRILMERFYQELAALEEEGEHPRKAEALKRAQLYLRELSSQEIRAITSAWADNVGAGQPVDSFAEPYYWAPFILVGNPV